MTPDEAVAAVAAVAAVDNLCTWSPWVPFNADTVHSAPQLPGVYVFRLPDTQNIVYVGMAGERTGSGAAQGLRGRLRVYVRGRGAVSGFGEAALDQALANPTWVEQQLAHLRTTGPKRAKVWAQEAIVHLAPEVRWTVCVDKAEALAVEDQVERLLGPHGLWNRVSQRARAASTPELSTREPRERPPGPHLVADHGPDDARFTVKGYTVDLQSLYREMHRYATVLPDGQRLFDGRNPEAPAMKHLINQLFDVPVSSKAHPVNHAIRSECRDRLESLGWATKQPGRSAKYTLHRPL